MNYFLAALKKYAVFSGRARRKEYWLFVLWLMIIFFILGALSAVIPSFIYLYYIVYLGILVPCFAVAVRRMHDVGKSGWFIFIPIYNLVLACTEGTPGTNQYGPDPKRPEFEDFLSDKAEPAQTGGFTK